MQDELQDLFPFYIAGTLSDKERRQVEAYLAESEEARKAFDEWQLIGDFVRSESAMWSRGMPPLANHVRESISASTTQTQPRNQRVDLPPLPKPPPQPDHSHSDGKVIAFPPPASTQPKVDRRRAQSRVSIPFTLVASVAMVLLLGSFLLLAVTRDDNSDADQFGASGDGTVIPLNSSTPIQTPDGTATEEDLGILSIPITDTPLPPQPTATAGAGERPFASVTATWTDIPGRCIARPASSSGINIYLAADETMGISELLPAGEYRRVGVYDPTGWYEVLGVQVGIAGWVRAQDVILSGPCSDLLPPSPTPTDTTQGQVCRIQSLVEITPSLFSQPNTSSPILGTIEQFTNVVPLARTGTGWYRVQYDSNGAVLVGWLNAADIMASDECQQLPIVNIPTTTPNADPQMSIPTPTASAPPSLNEFSAVSEQPATPGEVITLNWSTENTPRVSIELYGADVDPADYGSVTPLAVYSNLMPDGELDVVIPQSFSQPRAVFVLVMGVFNDDERGPTGIVAVDIDQ